MADQGWERACSRRPRLGLPVWSTTLEHQPDDGLGRGFVVAVFEFGLAGDGGDLPVKVGVGLGRRPDAEHQVMGVDRGDLATIDPGLDAGDIVLGLAVELFDLFFAQVRGAVHDFTGKHLGSKRQVARYKDL